MLFSIVFIKVIENITTRLMIYKYNVKKYFLFIFVVAIKLDFKNKSLSKKYNSNYQINYVVINL